MRRPADRINFNLRVDHALNKAHTLRAIVPAERQRSAEPRRRQLRSARPRVRADVDRQPAAAVGERTARPAVVRASRGCRSAGHDTTVVVGARSADRPRARRLHVGRRAAGRRTAQHRASSAPPTSTARSGRHCDADGRARRGRLLSQRQPHQLSRAPTRSRASPTTRPARRRPTRAASATRWSSTRSGRPGFFVQDDWRARKNLTLSAGVRQEFQTHLGDRWNFAPRGGLTWSPFKNGKTTVRAGGGIFYDWLEAETFEQTLRVDGVRQQDLVDRQPGLSGSVQRAARPGGPADEQVHARRRPRHAEARDR